MSGSDQDCSAAAAGELVAIWHYGQAALDELERVIDRLVDSLPNVTVFSTSCWLLPAARHLLAGREFRLLSIRRHSEVVALAPMTYGNERVAGLSVRSLRFLGMPYSDRIAVLADPDIPGAYSALIAGLVHRESAWDLIILDEILQKDVDTVSAMASAARSDVLFRVRHCSRSPVLQIPSTDVSTLENTFPRSLRIRLARARKKLVAAGRTQVQLIDHATPERLSRIRECAEIETLSWKGTHGVGIFQIGRPASFFFEVSERLFERASLNVWLLTLNGRTIAYRWQPQFRGCVLDYNFAHCPEAASLSPGRVLFAATIQAAAEVGLDCVDASRGGVDHAHLLADWSDDVIDHYALWLCNSTWRGRLVHWLSMRAKPRLESQLRGVRAASARFKHRLHNPP